MQEFLAAGSPTIILTTKAPIDKFKRYFRNFLLCLRNMVVIIDYQAGNLTSVERALEALGVEALVTAAPEVVARASRVVFPGVGAAGKAMHTLRERHLDQALLQAFERGVPIMGICLGAQIILDRSEENDALCLSGSTRCFRAYRRRRNIILFTAIIPIRRRLAWSWAGPSMASLFPAWWPGRTWWPRSSIRRRAGASA